MVVGQFGCPSPDFLAGYDGDGRGGRRLPDLRPVLVRRRDQPRQRLAGASCRSSTRTAGSSAGRAMFGHMTDVGGKVPGIAADRRHLDLRGRRRSSRRSSSTGRASSTTRCSTSILNQVRMQDWNRSDLNAIVAACRTAERRVIELCDRFGAEMYLSALDALLERNYDAMKQLIADDDPGRGDARLRGLRLRRRHAATGPTRSHCSMCREGDGVDPRLRPAPTRSRRARSTSTSTRTCSRCSSGST